MAGPIEEGAKVAGGIIDALKAQPAILALSLVNLALLIFIFYALHQAGKFREVLMNQVFQNTQRIHDVITQRSVQCPPCPRSEADQPLKSTEVVVEPLKPLEP